MGGWVDHPESGVTYLRDLEDDVVVSLSVHIGTMMFAAKDQPQFWGGISFGIDMNSLFNSLFKKGSRGAGEIKKNKVN